MKSLEKQACGERDCNSTVTRAIKVLERLVYSTGSCWQLTTEDAEAVAGVDWAGDLTTTALRARLGDVRFG